MFQEWFRAFDSARIQLMTKRVLVEAEWKLKCTFCWPGAYGFSTFVSRLGLAIDYQSSVYPYNLRCFIWHSATPSAALDT